MLTTATTFAGNNVKRILIVLALVVTSLGSYAAFSPKADAATAVSFCFRWADTGGAYANQPVRLIAGNGQVLRNGRTGANGCGTFSNTPIDRRLYVEGARVIGDGNTGWVSYKGSTPFMALTGGGTANLGTGWVYTTCIKGWYGTNIYC